MEAARKSDQKTLKVLNDWNKQARMIAFIREAPVPMPPKCAYLPLRGDYGSFPQARYRELTTSNGVFLKNSEFSRLITHSAATCWRFCG